MSTHNICFRDGGASNEYPQHMFSWRNKKNIMWIPPLICSYVALSGEALLMSTHNICFHGEIRKYHHFSDEKSALSVAMIREPHVQLSSHEQEPCSLISGHVLKYFCSFYWQQFNGLLVDIAVLKNCAMGLCFQLFLLVFPVFHSSLPHLGTGFMKDKISGIVSYSLRPGIYVMVVSFR